jgi:hypothetical protein
VGRRNGDRQLCPRAIGIRGYGLPYGRLGQSSLSLS